MENMPNGCNSNMYMDYELKISRRLKLIVNQYFIVKFICKAVAVFSEMTLSAESKERYRLNYKTVANLT